MIAVDEYVNFIVDNNLTQEQVLLLHLLYYDRADLIIKYKKKYPTEEGAMISSYLLNDLVYKGFIIKSKNSLSIGDEFLKIFVDGTKATEQIFNVYPSFVTSDTGVQIPMKSMDRNLFEQIYIPKILGSTKEHDEIIKDIKYGIENDLLRMGINKFLTSEHWKSIRQVRLADKEDKTVSHGLYEDF